MYLDPGLFKKKSDNMMMMIYNKIKSLVNWSIICLSYYSLSSHKLYESIYIKKRKGGYERSFVVVELYSTIVQVLMILYTSTNYIYFPLLLLSPPLLSRYVFVCVCVCIVCHLIYKFYTHEIIKTLLLLYPLHFTPPWCLTKNLFCWLFWKIS